MMRTALRAKRRLFLVRYETEEFEAYWAPHAIAALEAFVAAGHVPGTPATGEIEVELSGGTAGLLTVWFGVKLVQIQDITDAPDAEDYE